MKRSDLLRQTATLGLIAAGAPGSVQAAANNVDVPVAPLDPTADGVPVAFLLSEGAVVIDFTGPWEVFQDVDVTGRKTPAFNLFTVAEAAKPLTASGGMTVVPHYTFSNAPAPKVVVVPAQSDPTAAVKEWLVSTARTADLVMSVCTGAFVLAQAGLLDGLTVTTHHSGFTMMGMHYPDVTLARGVRFTDNGRIATSAGLSAGIDLALHVVARYYGKQAARQTAYDMEYLSTHWLDADNAAYGKPPPVAKAGNAICPVCWMEVDPKTATVATYRGVKYYFCIPEHARLFAAAPARFLSG
jgi:putative intracellular protease/amidase/YHS domain-containing protein